MKPVTTRIEFTCKKCALSCTVVLTVDKALEEKRPTTELRRVCPFFASRDNFALFEKVNQR